MRPLSIVAAFVVSLALVGSVNAADKAKKAAKKAKPVAGTVTEIKKDEGKDK